MTQFGLRDVYDMEIGKSQNNIFEKDPDDLYQLALKKDKRLAKLWKRAEVAGFSGIFRTDSFIRFNLYFSNSVYFRLACMTLETMVF